MCPSISSAFLLILSAAFARADLPLCDSVTRDGITWRFSEPVQAGRFANGDYYVVGPVTVTSISPQPTEGRNGSVKNLSVDQGISGFDDRVSSNRFRANLRVIPPIDLEAGDALISSISLDSLGQCEPWLREGNEAPSSPVRSYSILTCCASPLPEGSFRPSYCDRQQKIHSTANLRRDLLSRLPKVGNMPDISVWAEHFRRPWLDVCFFGFDAATEYQAVYGREVARSVGIATLLLNCDYTGAEKESLLVNIVQYGIDLWGTAAAGYPGWQAHGGHGSGRKWPIIFAGIMLGDSSMASPNRAYPSLRFGEDMQTMRGECWTGAKVVYAGHQGVIDGDRVSETPGWGPYEHKPPSEWADSNKIGEDYRRCCTSISWVGEALAARLMGAVDNWSHDPFFEYVDRWMTEDDSAAVKAIEDARGWDYSSAWSRQGQCWDKFVENMWSSYRFLPIRTGNPRRGGLQEDAKPLRGRVGIGKTSDFYTIGGRKLARGERLPRGIVIGKGNGLSIIMAGSD